MPRETTTAKAQRYLAEGKLTIDLLLGDRVYATAHGEAGDVYRLGHTAERGWECSCPARRGCAHLAALRTVTVRR